jgi:hypothetical protein
MEPVFDRLGQVTAWLRDIRDATGGPIKAVPNVSLFLRCLQSRSQPELGG